MERLKRLEKMLEARAGEALSFWRRSKRVFEAGGQWYFRTREDIDVGPYRTQFEAEVEADLLKRKLQQTPDALQHNVVRAFMLESVSLSQPAGLASADVVRPHWHADIGVI